MKLRHVSIVATVAAAVAGLMFGYTQMSRERAADEAADQPIAAASRVRTGTNGEAIITLDAKTQQLIGLQTASLVAATLPPQVKAWGRVLDSAALVALHNDVIAAQADSRAARAEYERQKKLSTENNASVRALESAEAQMKRAQGALATAEMQLAAASSRAVLDEPADFFQSLARQDRVLVRLDLPAGEPVPETPVGAWVNLLGATQPVAADFIGRSAVTDPQAQGAGFIFGVTNALTTLAPGLSLTGSLLLPGAAASGVNVPDAAVVRAAGRAWIYLQTTDTTFSRREILLNHPVTGGWFVSQGAKPGDKVVVTGAQTLLSEEHKSEIQMGD